MYTRRRRRNTHTHTHKCGDSLKSSERPACGVVWSRHLRVMFCSACWHARPALPATVSRRDSRNSVTRASSGSSTSVGRYDRNGANGVNGRRLRRLCQPGRRTHLSSAGDVRCCTRRRRRYRRRRHTEPRRTLRGDCLLTARRPLSTLVCCHLFGRPAASAT